MVERLVPMLIVAGLVAGCSPGTDAAHSPGIDTAQLIQKVEAQTKQVCKFVPEAKPIVELIPTFGGVASQIADAICNAVNSTPVVAAPGASTVVSVGNVAVPGVFVR